MDIQFDFGVGAIRSYKRLSYTPWHALAEFVDNATQNYLANRQELDAALADADDSFLVSIVYERGDVLRITDNALGMRREDLERALQVGVPPDDVSGRSEFGMGLKTAACWIGDEWSVRTKRLGDPTELTVVVDVEAVAAGETDLEVRETEKDPSLHYTVIEIRRHHHRWVGRTLGKIKDYLRSMYRVDIRNGDLELQWQNERLEWEESDDRFVVAPSGEPYKKDFGFDVGGKSVTGWVGVLDRGSRAKAGFSMLRRGRVIKGWPDSWRPSSIFGMQEGGSNTLVNQRIVGEINLDEFTVSHQKDDIQWMGDEEELVEAALLDLSRDYIDVAQTRRRNGDDERGPSDVEVKTAIEEFQAELESGAVVDTLELDEIPPPEVVEESFQPLIRGIEDSDPAFSATLPSVRVSGYLAMNASANDPYVAVESPANDHVVVSINVAHPHWRQITGAEGVLNYFRDCTYDALAEWKARRAQQLEPHTVKLFKDRFLRVGLSIETHLPEPESEIVD